MGTLESEVMTRAKRVLLLLLPVLAACAAQPPTFIRTGAFEPGGTILVRNLAGDIGAYAPERTQASDVFTVAAYEPKGAPPTTIAFHPSLISVQANAPGVRFLVRSPAGVSLDLATRKGNINVADVEGVVNAHTDRGDVKMLIPMYGNASTGAGNVSVIFASTDWPGTVRFTTVAGDVELYVNENAKAHVRLHTDNGTIFTDFNLRGTSNGNAETIDSTINGGGPRSVDVDVKTGSIRLMQLKPQV